MLARIVYYEFKRQICRKEMYVFIIFMFLNLYFFEFVNTYLVGPIGIFSNSEKVVSIINGYGSIAAMRPINLFDLNKDFFEVYSNLENASAQLAREFFDILGSFFFVGSFLIGLYTIDEVRTNKEKSIFNIKSTSYVLGKYFGSVLYVIFIISFLSIIPFVMSFRLQNLGLSGSPFDLAVYLFGWLVPTIFIIISIHFVLSLIIKEKFICIIIHFILCILLINPNIKNYPFYKLIIRFNGKSEEFYQEVKNQIILNRTITFILAIVILLLAVFLIKKVIKLKNEKNIN